MNYDVLDDLKSILSAIYILVPHWSMVLSVVEGKQIVHERMPSELQCFLGDRG